VKVEESYLLLLWLWTPILLPFILSQFLPPIYVLRYTIAASLAFYLLVASGIRSIEGRGVRVFLIALFGFVSLFNVATYYKKTTRTEWRDVVAYIDRNAGERDLVVINPKFSIEPVFNYYSKRENLQKTGFPREGWVVDESNVGELTQGVAGHERLWMVIWHEDKNGIITNALEEGYNSVLRRKYKGLELHLYQKKVPLGLSPDVGRLRFQIPVNPV
jgi:hypothetical protein